MKSTQNENIIRTYKGVTLRDRIRIQDIREELEIQDVVRWASGVGVTKWKGCQMKDGQTGP